ncbi:MAG: TetR/AcrR family transcriptional regulator [Janthinobacterium lividum]
MTIRDTGTEQLIKDTAKRVFFLEGRLNATTQDIADAAGVNRTLLNYYFRSRDILFQQVFEEATNEIGKRLDEVMDSDLPFKQKIENLITVFLAETTLYPYRETFLVTQINCHVFMFKDTNKPHKIREFIKQIQEEMDKGNVRHMNPLHFIMNLFSLMVYPLIMAPLNKQLFDVDDEKYSQLMAERKELILAQIFS